MSKKFKLIGPEGFPDQPEPYDTHAEAEAAKAPFIERFRKQGFYSGIGFQIPFSEIGDHLTIEEIEDDEENPGDHAGDLADDDDARHLGDENPGNDVDAFGNDFSDADPGL